MIDRSNQIRELCSQLNLPFVESLAEEGVEPEIYSKLPISFAKKFKLVPIGREGNLIKVAITNPLDLQPLDSLRMLLDTDIIPIVSTESEVTNAINQFYNQTSNSAEQIIQDMNDEDSTKILHELEET
ncbi:MAG: hypothetical protein SVW57_12860, partial [Thermodesulfobacteriota bacterium]|nr:hypothetical protein [Thermodesulfobacteriota bacterium]